ncbi:MAG: glycine cleavage system protein GcvH [Propionibacteriaceae bacterium]|jgi:glycine cleavage system H protein|nr:glycine cleavage system protein GcvH [Propionibacteriaceae bacterium]
MTIPADLLYTSDHEWVADSNGPLARVGITAFASEALGDIVYLSLPQPGDTVKAGESCGEIESTKSVSDLYAPVSGSVAEINQAVLDAPELVGDDPYGQGWLFTVHPDGSEADLLDAVAYAALTGSPS